MSSSSPVTKADPSNFEIVTDEIEYRYRRAHGLTCQSARQEAQTYFARRSVCFAGCAYDVKAVVLTPSRAGSVRACIPSSVEVLRERSEAGERCSVAFEAGSSLLHIESGAFADCRWLSSICIPSSVESLGDNCFKACLRLSSVTFQPGSRLSRIESRAFGVCQSLSWISIPSSVKVIGGECFWACCELSGDIRG
jgi:hypothetical protein